MTLQSIKRTPIRERPPGRPSLDQRAYRDKWPEIRLNAASVEHDMTGVAETARVAIVDSGVPHAYSSNPSGNDRDDDGHAALLAETIRPRNVASANNIQISFVKAFSAQGWPEPDVCAEAIKRAAGGGARVMVLAWDVGHTTKALEQAIEDLKNQALVVVAAGNWSLDIDRHPNWPANYGRMDHVLTVMATDEDDQRASYSSYGKESVCIAAPGVATLDAAGFSQQSPNGSLRNCQRVFRGTSAATAHVARLAALVLAKKPELATPKAVKQHILAKARSVDSLKKIGKNGAGEKLCATEAITDFARTLA